MLKRHFAAVLVLSVLLNAARPSSGDFIIQPELVTSSKGQLNASVGPEKLRDQSGLSASYVSGTTDFTAYTATTTFSNSGSDVWVASSPSTPPANLDFNLGSVNAINAVALWNGDGNGSVNAFTLFASADSSFTSTQNLGSFSAADLATPVPAQVFSFATVFTQYVRLRIDSNHGATGIAAGMGEVAFSAVPEPSSFIFVGIIVVGVVGRLRWKRWQSA